MIVGLAVALLIVGARVVSHAQPGGGAKHPAAAAGVGGGPAFTVDPAFLATWQDSLSSAAAAHGPGSYAVEAIDLTTGTTLGVDADTPYRAASVNKLELAVDLYRQAQAHTIDLDATTVIQDADIQHYGTGTIQLQPGPQTYTWRALTKLMFQESDNTAAFVIGNRLGLANVQADLAAWGLTHTSMANNMTTAHDAALLLGELAQHKLLPGPASDELTGYLEHTAWPDRIPSGVPAGTLVAHKIGTDVGVFNDAGIVFHGSRPYVLAVLGSNAGEDDGLQAITAISQTVYTFELDLPGNVHPTTR